MNELTLIQEGTLIAENSNNQSVFTYTDKETFLTGYYLVNEKKRVKKISEKEAIREYLDPECIKRHLAPEIVFPKSILKLANSWQVNKNVSRYRAGLISFELSTELPSQNTKLKLIEGSLSPRPKTGQGIKA